MRFIDEPAPPEWLQREYLRETIEENGLPFVAEAVWRRPLWAYIEKADADAAIALNSELLSHLRCKLAVSRDLRDALWRCVQAGFVQRRRSQKARPETAVAVMNPARVQDLRSDARRPDAEARQCEPRPDAPLVIRRRGEEGRHDAK